MFRDLPKDWGKPGKSWWVWLHEKFYSRADTNKSGSRHKQLQVHADGPFAVTEISDDRIHFKSQKPEWMSYRQDDHFTVKAIRAIQDTHPEPDKALTEAVDADTSADLDEGVFEFTKVWARRKSSTKKAGYEYKVQWRGYPIYEAKHVHESDISGSLVAKYDEVCPRGSVRTDHAADIHKYLQKHPGYLNLRSSTVPTDDAIVTSDTVGATEGAGGDSGDTYSITEAVARANAPKSSTKTYKSSKSATTVSKRGRIRTAPARLLMQIEPARQQRLYEHLNNLFLNDINDYEWTVSEISFACDMAS